MERGMDRLTDQAMVDVRWVIDGPQHAHARHDGRRRSEGPRRDASFHGSLPSEGRADAEAAPVGGRGEGQPLREFFLNEQDHDVRRTVMLPVLLERIDEGDEIWYGMFETTASMVFGHVASSASPSVSPTSAHRFLRQRSSADGPPPRHRFRWHEPRLRRGAGGP
ncbi:MAG: hypothetical protein CM15mP18_0850 [Methanobacteriota archaeon]|nr:MAG: hypothetical protein CM15mP18_0850 [Euryarchaeota archaeon]